MDIQEVVREAVAVWHDLKKESITQEDIDGILKVVDIMTRGGAAREYTEGVQRLLGEIGGTQVAPIPVIPEQDREELERKLRKQRVQYRVQTLKELTEIAHALEGTVCPLSLLGEYPRECLMDKCEWWNATRSLCGVLS